MIVLTGITKVPNCIDCPLLDNEDNCKGQKDLPEYVLEKIETWDDLKKNCPLKEVHLPERRIDDPKQDDLQTEYINGYNAAISEMEVENVY